MFIPRQKNVSFTHFPCDGLDLSKSSTFRHSADLYSFILLCIFLKDSEVFILFIYGCGSVPYGAAAHRGLKKVSQALGRTGVTGGCEPCDVGAWNCIGSSVRAAPDLHMFALFCVYTIEAELSEFTPFRK